MASSLFLLLDDIASVMDDVATMTKVATKKTAGVLGDDLALNAEQVTGLHPEREIPIVLAVAKGSFLNKLILVPSALAISAVLPQAIKPLLMIGGAYLCFEGFEKVFGGHHESNKAQGSDKSHPEFEKEKIHGAVRTDFILSAEIIVISLGAVDGKSFAVQAGVLASIALLMTVGVYGLVAAIVKLDDLGLHLVSDPGRSRGLRIIGHGLLQFAPKLMHFLSIAGTIAMFLVGGGIFVHAIKPLEELAKQSGLFLETLLNGGVGLVVGALCLAGLQVIKKLNLSRSHKGL